MPLTCINGLTAQEVALAFAYVCLGITVAALAVHLALRAWQDLSTSNEERPE